MNRQEVYEYFDTFNTAEIDQLLDQLKVPRDQTEDLPVTIVQAVENLMNAVEKAKENPSKALTQAQASGDIEAQKQAIAIQVLESVDLTQSLRDAGCTNQQLLVVLMHTIQTAKYEAQAIYKAREAGFVAETQKLEREFQGKLIDGFSQNRQRVESVLNDKTIDTLVQKQIPQTEEVDWTPFINNTLAQAKVETPKATKVENPVFDLEAEFAALGL